MKVTFIGGRADGAFVEKVTENDTEVWVTDSEGEPDTMRIYFNPPIDHSGSADFYELHRAWPSLRWFYVVESLVDSKLGGQMLADPTGDF